MDAKHVSVDTRMILSSCVFEKYIIDSCIAFFECDTGADR